MIDYFIVKQRRKNNSTPGVVTRDTYTAIRVSLNLDILTTSLKMFAR
jgi:hypothetical protein